jgi:RNase H-like domain found in reverse transcriptase
MSPLAAADFECIKQDIAKSVVNSISNEELLVVESDASDFALAATLSQSGRPVAFFSRSLTECEKRHSSIEKEAYAIVEAVRKWKHFLIGRHFKLITDQEAVSFMFNLKHSSKIKSDKITRWRLELSSFSYDIVYRPGKDNTVADAFSRVCANINNPSKLFDLHKALCHPGMTRMYHWTRSKNLPFTLDDIKRVTTTCPICAEVKPKFFKQDGNHLIKATSPFE